MAAIALALASAPSRAAAPAEDTKVAPAAGPHPKQAAAKPDLPALSPELMYRLLLGDIALQRGQTALGARAYYEAARDTKSAFLARRATEIALAARQRSTALSAAKLWGELEPDAERPKQIVAAITILDVIPKPNQVRKTGASATRGVIWKTTMSG